ncbi:MAG TPA: hypothetical protein VJS30_06800 [Paraburkholderia sp.]|nr:hypothetical protein [Paraburkholderia sp.]
MEFFNWAFDHGTDTVDALDFIPLPEPVLTKIRAQWPAIADESMAGKRLAGR